ncbi:leucine-rich repeat domain-containing protein [Lignipirellula cremea]|uniref:Leucine Rich repeats (2 copies) n=1 Tax=Lignipirellula cremea TaxID=2528010 RepID=A0A518DRV4_9BACT|nr:hypothetical protein [Lignipirellula cremea]QDU94566.1 Leucine Rich repeats (2 copies) [Lignipirellula cremea]
MHRLMFPSVLLLLSLVATLQAAEPTVAALEGIGAEVTQSGGVVTGLKADCTGFGDEQYRLIGQAKSLKSLTLSGPDLTDENLAALAGLSQLEMILVNGGKITDAGMKHFTAFPKLKQLSLFHFSRGVEAFTGSGFVELRGLPELRRLTHAGATTGDQAMEAIAQLTQLESYSQWHNLESPQGWVYLTRMPNLKSLRIGQRLPARGHDLTPTLDGAALKTIARIQPLETLSLMEARLSYDDLAVLKSLPNLKLLSVKSVDTPAADVERLRELLPNVRIDWEPLSEADAELLTKKLKI